MLQDLRYRDHAHLNTFQEILMMVSGIKASIAENAMIKGNEIASIII